MVRPLTRMVIALDFETPEDKDEVSDKIKNALKDAFEENDRFGISQPVRFTSVVGGTAAKVVDLLETLSNG